MTLPSIDLSGTELSVPNGLHMCLLYRDDVEQLRTIARFFSAAAEEKHKVLYITDAHPPANVRRRFAEFRVDLSESSGAEVQTTTEAYYPDGRFEPERMLTGLDSFATRSVETGFAGCRCAGEMGWAAREVPGSERLLEYEVMLTELIERRPFSGICQYDVRLFDGATLLAILEVHPFLLVRGQVLRNPNFVRRNEFGGWRVADDHPTV
jgi:hypothetical protein